VLILESHVVTLHYVRFKKSLPPHHLSAEVINSVEKQGGIVISLLFVAIAGIVGGQAAEHLHLEKKPHTDAIMLSLAAISVVAFFILGGFKWHISEKLSSSTLKKDAICSIAVAIISLAITISASVYSATDAVWWFDASVAVLVSIFLFIYGMKTLFCHGHVWWRGDFWKSAEEDVHVDIGTASEMQENSV